MIKLLLISTVCLFMTGCMTTIDKSVLSSINNHVNNSFEYTSDTQDQWKQPKQFYNDGGGDCEDFSIAKYFLVKEKYPNAKLEIMLLHDKITGMDHAVLLVNDYLVLDNQIEFIAEIHSLLFKQRYIILHRQESTFKPK